MLAPVSGALPSAALPNQESELANSSRFQQTPRLPMHATRPTCGGADGSGPTAHPPNFSSHQPVRSITYSRSATCNNNPRCGSVRFTSIPQLRLRENPQLLNREGVTSNSLFLNTLQKSFFGGVKPHRIASNHLHITLVVAKKHFSPPRRLTPVSTCVKLHSNLGRAHRCCFGMCGKNSGA